MVSNNNTNDNATTNRHYLVSAKLNDGSTYNQEWHDLWDGQTSPGLPTQSPLQALLDLLYHQDGAERDGMIERIQSTIATGEESDFGGYRYEWVITGPLRLAEITITDLEEATR